MDARPQRPQLHSPHVGAQTQHESYFHMYILFALRQFQKYFVLNLRQASGGQKKHPFVNAANISDVFKDNN